MHVPNMPARGTVGAGTFRPGITPGSPTLAAGPLGILSEALGGVLGGLAGGAIASSGDGGPGEAQPGFSQPACVQQLHVSCGHGHAQGPAEDWDEADGPCCSEHEGLD